MLPFALRQTEPVAAASSSGGGGQQRPKTSGGAWGSGGGGGSSPPVGEAAESHQPSQIPSDGACQRPSTAPEKQQQQQQPRVVPGWVAFDRKVSIAWCSMCFACQSSSHI